MNHIATKGLRDSGFLNFSYKTGKSRGSRVPRNGSLHRRSLSPSPSDPLCNSPAIAMAAKFPPLALCHSYPNSNRIPLLHPPSSLPCTKRRRPAPTIPAKSVPRATLRCAKRAGRRRYPSEKKKLERMNKTLTQTEIRVKGEGFWRFSKLAVPVHRDPGKDFLGVSLPLLEAISKVLEFPVIISSLSFFCIFSSLSRLK